MTKLSLTRSSHGAVMDLTLGFERRLEGQDLDPLEYDWMLVSTKACGTSGSNDRCSWNHEWI